MQLKVIDQQFSVCKIENVEHVDFSGEFCFLGKTDDEISLVCSTNNVPAQTIERNDGWRAFKIQGVLDFSLIGVLATISTILADNKIGIFVVSTYNTDYILVKEGQFEEAMAVLAKSDYVIDR